MHMTSPAPPPAVALHDICKAFGGVQANNGITLEIAQASIHGIIGENGAGKSTLMSVLFGFYQADSGRIAINGADVTIKSPQDAIRLGLGMVHQHFMLIGTLSVLENVLLGCEGGLTLNTGMTKARAALETLKKEYGLDVPLDAAVGTLTVGQQQRVEILKALYRGADVLILDEPTGVLTPAEADHLFSVLRHLKAQGKTVLLITHKLREIMAITDKVSVMRRGALVDTVVTAATTPDALAEMMVGRSVRLNAVKTASSPGRAVLEVQNLNVWDAQGVKRVDDVSFTVHAGEVLGLAGVAGNGQSELVEALTGLTPWQGRIAMNGQTVDSTTWNPRAMRDSGVAHVPEDRHRRAMVMDFTAAENMVLGYERDVHCGKGPFLNVDAISRDTAAKMERYDIRPRAPHLKSSLFSGGNQQKLVLARELGRHPDLLIVGQPTRGVDIGAIEFIHKQILAMRDAGKAILLVSVELDEIRALSDRIAVMFAGKMMGTCSGDAQEREIGRMMAGMAPDVRTIAA